MTGYLHPPYQDGLGPPPKNSLLTLAEKAQTTLARAGGVPINADLSQIEDEKVRELNEAFSTLLENDALAFYPDWPAPGYMDVLGGGLQELIAGSMTPEEFNESISTPYYDYKASLEQAGIDASQ